MSQDMIRSWGGDNLYTYADTPTGWIDPWDLRSTNSGRMPSNKIIPPEQGHQR